MVWRFAISCSLALLLAVQAPAWAEGQQPVSPLAPAPAPAARARTRRDTALVLLVAGGILAASAVFYGVRFRSDEPSTEGAIAGVGLFIAVPTLAAGIGLLLPDDPNARPSSNYPRLAQLPRGLTLRLTF